MYFLPKLLFSIALSEMFSINDEQFLNYFFFFFDEKFKKRRLKKLISQLYLLLSFFSLFFLLYFYPLCPKLLNEFYRNQILPEFLPEFLPELEIFYDIRHIFTQDGPVQGGLSHKDCRMKIYVSKYLKRLKCLNKYLPTIIWVKTSWT